MCLHMISGMCVYMCVYISLSLYIYIYHPLSLSIYIYIHVYIHGRLHAYRPSQGMNEHLVDGWIQVFIRWKPCSMLTLTASQALMRVKCYSDPLYIQRNSRLCRSQHEIFVTLVGTPWSHVDELVLFMSAALFKGWKHNHVSLPLSLYTTTTTTTDDEDDDDDDDDEDDNNSNNSNDDDNNHDNKQ